MTNQLLGAYGPFTAKIDDRATSAFSEAMEHIVGVQYSPVAVASQVVSGTNYAFFCNAQIPGIGNTVYPAMVNVYQPLNGSAVITHIAKISY
jgi:hypothetical protein